MPVTFMTDEHMAALAAKCSKKSNPAMPHFPVASPSKTENQNASHTVTPPPNGATTQANKNDGKKDDSKSSIVTPQPGSSKSAKQPSKQALAMHRKWQEAAEAMGGPGTRIVVNKKDAKKIIFDLLFDAFRPMNITQVFTVGQLPNPHVTAQQQIASLVSHPNRSFAVQTK
jgi:hypothetical protein